MSLWDSWWGAPASSAPARAIRRPVWERKTGFTRIQKSLALLAAPERVLGWLARRSNLVLRFDCHGATPNDLATLLPRRIHVVARVYPDATAAGWARDRLGALDWLELSSGKWVAELSAATGSHLGGTVVPQAGCADSTGMYTFMYTFE